MTSSWRLAAAALAGVVAGAAGALVLPVDGARRPAPVSGPTQDAVEAPPPLETIPVRKPTEGVLLAWSPGSLPAGAAAAALSAHGVRDATVVRADGVDLAASYDGEGGVVDQPPGGMVFPLDAIAFDPATYPSFVPASQRQVFAGLGDGEVLLGETSAGVRRLGEGATLRLGGGQEVRVAGVVDDAALGAAEIAFSYAGGATVGVVTERWLLVQYGEGRGPVEDALRAAFPPDLAVRFRGPGETPWLRAGDAVLPQVFLKERFGEFAYRPPTGGADEFAQDPTWQADHLVDADVPVLGRVRCHRTVVEALAGAMAELEAEGLAHLVAPGGYDGCHNARTVRSGAGLSRHAWGVAVDLNYGENPTGVESEQDPRLVEVMDRWGFGWGGLWLVRDPAHFEYLRPPDP